MAEQANSKLLEGITYFEKMLKVMPGDRTTLEFLSVAYEQLGDVEKQRTALIQLAETLLREKDYDAADAIGERLSGFAESDAQDMARRIKSVRNPIQLKAVVRPGASTGPGRVATRPSNAPSPVGAGGTHALPEGGISLAQVVMSAVKAEAALIRDLYAKNVVDASAAEVVQRHLGGLPEATRPFLVSALAILEKESGGIGEKAAVYMADAASAPPIPLQAFMPSAALVKQLPEEIVRVRGAVPFGRLGDTLLVAVLNPLDTAFHAEVESLAGCPCRFFLADPHTTEDFLEKYFAENA